VIQTKWFIIIRYLCDTISKIISPLTKDGRLDMISSSTLGSHASYKENFQAYDRIDGTMHVLCSTAFKLIF